MGPLGPLGPRGPAQHDPTAPQTAGQWLRLTANAVNLSTPLGLLVAAVGRASLRLGPRGLILAEGYRLPFPIAGAFTVGDVVITASDFASLSQQYPALLEHEESHSRQYCYCLGLPFLLAYSVGVGWSLLRTGDRAAANFFEVQAGLASGGYPSYPTRPLGVAVKDLTGRVRRLWSGRVR